MDGFTELLIRMIRDRQLFLPIVALGLIVLCWSLVRPSMFTDDNKMRLPFKPVPRALFAFISLSVYLMLFALFYAFPSYAADVAQQLYLGSLFRVPPESLGTNLSGDATTLAVQQLSAIRTRAPYFAVVAQGLLLQLRFVREIENSVAVWLHSRRHLSHDIADFARFLSERPFHPDESERQKNRAYVRRFGLNVTDLTLDTVGLVAFERWEKVATLVRALKEWVAQDPTILIPDEHKQIDALEKAHDRKTELAINIIKLISDRGGDVPALLSELKKGAGDADAAPRSRLEELIAASSNEMADHTVALTGEQLKRRLEQIQQLFDHEYHELLTQTATLAARSVLLAKPHAADQRFERLKEAGFDFLGHLPRVSFDRLLATFFVVAVPGFFVMFVTNRGASVEALARFTCIMAIAALIGVAVGSRKSNATAEEAPWSRYLVAGLISAIIFVCVNMATYTLKRALHVQLPPAAASPNIWITSTWSILPLLVTVSIAVLARLDSWQAPARLRPWKDIWERFVDGVMVSAAVLVAYYIALTVHTEAGWKLPPDVANKMGTLKYLPFPILWPLQAFGFLIGAFVVRNARKIAHRTMLKPESRSSVTSVMPAGAAPAAV